MGHYKALIGPRPRACSFADQQTEAAIGVAVLNRMLAVGHPKSVGRPRIITLQTGAGVISNFIRPVHQGRLAQDVGCILPRVSLLWWRLNVAGRIGRRRRRIGAGLGRGIRGRADNGAYRDARRDATPVWSAVVVAVAAAAASTVDVHVPVHVDVGSPVRVDVGSPVRVDAPVAGVRRVLTEVVAIEVSLAVRAACSALPTTARRPLTTRSLTATTSTILNEDQSRVIELANCADSLQRVVQREWRNRCRHGAARERQGGREHQCGSLVHVNAPDIWPEGL